MKSFVVDLWAKIFKFLKEKTSLSIGLTYIFTSLEKNYGYVEVYIITNFLLSFALLLISSVIQQIGWWRIIIMVWGGYRIYEIVVHSVNTAIFDSYRYLKEGRSYWVYSHFRSVILTLFNYIEVIVWFAILYQNLSILFIVQCLNLKSFWGSILFSVSIMTTLGFANFQPTNIGIILVIFQLLISLLLILLVLTIFIARLPRSKSIEAIFYQCRKTKRRKND